MQAFSSSKNKVQEIKGNIILFRQGKPALWVVELLQVRLKNME